MELSKTAVAELKALVVRMTSVDSFTLPKGQAERFHWDPTLPGFGIRIRGASARWVVGYRINGRQRRESLGDIRKVTLEAARKIARIRFGQAEQGIDPVAQKGEARAKAEAEKLTFGIVAKQFLKAKNGIVKPQTHVRMVHDLLTLWGPFANKPFNLIKRQDIAARLHQIVDECSKRGSARSKIIGVGGRAAAGNARRNLSSLYSWAMGEGLCETNPVINSNNPADGLTGRSRVLTDRELALLWHACEPETVASYCRTDSYGTDFGRIIRLLILTGCRREEIGQLRWSEIDLNTGILNIPGERTKNGNPLKLSLPALALDIIRSATPPSRERQFVFGNGRTPFDSYQYRMMIVRERISREQGETVPYFVVHDLRRTLRTGMGRLGIPPHIAERVVNHVKITGVQAIYDRYKYEDEMKDALQKWADHVASVVGINVVKLKGASDPRGNTRKFLQKI